MNKGEFIGELGLPIRGKIGENGWILKGNFEIQIEDKGQVVEINTNRTKSRNQTFDLKPRAWENLKFKPDSINQPIKNQHVL